MADPAHLDPVALDGSPAQAYAAHRARANGYVRHFAGSRPLSAVGGKASENNTVALLAHLHAAADDPDFAVPGEEPSRTAAPKALLRLNKGDGEVGTHKDYDMALKGLMTILHRYPATLGPAGVAHIMNELVPPGIAGGHPSDMEVIVDIPVLVEYPETENHLLMIESTRYLVNQRRFDTTSDARFDNTANGLTRWLLGYLQRIAKHDFLEFNSRPYQRLALHPILNLHEFARDESLRLAAQHVLDYVTTKYAVSSNRLRRVGPFRRLQHRIDHHANDRNDHFARSGDQVAQVFAAYSGYTDRNGDPAPTPDTLVDIAGVVAATAAYRPPPAAYTVALARDLPAAMHRFHHGVRPELRAAGEVAEGGLEMYYRSPSFLISAGGSFLNSGYGRDEFDTFKEAWEQTSRAQAVTLIPTRADTRFHDLIRFEPVPDPAVDPYHDDPEDPDTLRATAVNTAVHRGLMAGANLRPGRRRTVREQTTSLAPALTLHKGVLKIAWRGAGNENLNVADVQSTDVLGMAGVEGITGKIVTPDTTDRAPALASHDTRLYLAWRGSGNENLNLAHLDEAGRVFVEKHTSGERSEHQPALAAHNGRLYLAWTGLDDHVNVAQVQVLGNTQGRVWIGGLENKIVTAATSATGPALASHNGRLYLGWKGSGNDALNLAFSEDDGRSFAGTTTFGDTSSHAPALASHDGRLFYAWKGSGNEQLNVARVVLIGNSDGGFGIDSLENKVVLPDFSEEPPALCSHLGHLCLAWKGEGEDRLNLFLSRDGSSAPVGPWEFLPVEHLGFHVAVCRTPPGRTDGLDAVPDDFALVYAMETGGMPFATFVSETTARNTHLPARLDHDGRYAFHAPDGRNFSVWIHLTADKYRERISEQGAEIGDLRSVPLVRGEYLTSPNGHDGLLRIPDPRNPAAPPLELDFRDATRPVRVDNRATSPGPWLERAQALFAIASRFAAQGRRTDARAATVDAAGLYDEFVRLDPEGNGRVLASSVIGALGGAGVDFSVPESDLRDWLANPEFTPYPSLAVALLRGRAPSRPVFLDVIAFNYENTPGVSSPRRAVDVRPDVLRQAVLDGFNVRYGTTLTDPEAVFLPA